ncbi:hypothetical protein [Peribacillus kribbensis]|nr:hypothetical protein [Peribacillus kribbensis]
MLVCELCGKEEETESEDRIQSRMLHVCETCQQDQSVNYFEL